MYLSFCWHKTRVSVVTGLPVRNSYSIPYQGTDKVPQLKWLTVSTVVLKAYSHPNMALSPTIVAEQFLSSKRVATEVLV